MMSESYNSLHAAAGSGDVDKVRKILQSGVYDVNCRNLEGYTPLHLACAGGHVGVVRELAKHNANICGRDDDNNTPLHVAAWHGNDEVALVLITEFNCDVTVKGHHGRSVLHNACHGGSVDLVRTLVLKHGADLTARDDLCDTPLHVAAFAGKDDVALVLITEFNCDITVKGYTGRSLLHSACYGGSINLVRTLVLKHGADLTAKDDANDTPLHVAAFVGKDKVALILITEFNCDVTVKGCNGRTVLHSACCGGSLNLVLTLVLEHGADVSAKDDSNDTPLHMAAFYDKEEVALVLITKFNCFVTTKGHNGRSVLHSACCGGSVNLVRTLVLEHEADLTARDDSNDTPLHVAALAGEDEVALVLITEFNGDVTVKGYNGRSLLHSACCGGSVNLVRTLVLKHGADITATDDMNRMPLHVAEESNQGEVVSLLKTELHCSYSIPELVYNQSNNSAAKDGTIRSNWSNNTANETTAEHLRRTKEMALGEHNAISQGPQALINASKENKYDKVKLLLEKGVEVDLQDVEGWSALMHASSNGYSEVVNLLLVYNADIDLQSPEWESALSLALNHGHSEVITQIKARLEKAVAQHDKVIYQKIGEAKRVNASHLLMPPHATTADIQETQHCNRSKEGAPESTVAENSSSFVDLNLSATIVDQVKEDSIIATTLSVDTSYSELRETSFPHDKNLEPDKSVPFISYNVPLSLNTMTLIKWRDQQGRERKFRLIDMVSAKWRKFGRLLNQENNQLDGWEVECLKNADQCWCKVMGHWLAQQEELYPVTWSGLFTLLEDAEYSQVVIELDTALRSAIVPTPKPTTSTKAQKTIQYTTQASGEEFGRVNNIGTASIQDGENPSIHDQQYIRSVCVSIGRWVISISRFFHRFFVLYFRSFSFSTWRVFIFGSFLCCGVFVSCGVYVYCYNFPG